MAFSQTVLFYFLQRLPSVQAAGDESGLGRQICWEAAKQFGSRFLKVNFASKKHDLGFALMNQLAVAEKRFPKSEADIAADYFALRKAHNGSKWSFSEGRNTLNAASHCDRLGRRAGQLCPHRNGAAASARPSATTTAGSMDASIIPIKQNEPEQLSPSAEHQQTRSDAPRIWYRLG